MNFRNERPHQFTDEPDRDVPSSSSSPDTDSPLAAERLSEAVDRITRKMDRVVVRQPPSEQSKGPLRLLGAGIIILTIITIFGIFMRDRKATSDRLSVEQPAAVQQLPKRQLDATSLTGAPQPPVRIHADAASAKKTRSSAKGNIPVTTTPSQQTDPAHRTPGSPPAVAQSRNRSRPEVRTHPATPAHTSTDDEETDIDKTTAFYEPVNRQAKSGTFDVRSENTGRSIYRSGPAQSEGARTGKRSLVKATTALAAKSGGTLDEVMEHNGNYYKIKLTIPIKRLESFKKLLADDDAIATLSVTTKSTSGAAAVIILELHTR